VHPVAVPGIGRLDGGGASRAAVPPSDCGVEAGGDGAWLALVGVGGVLGVVRWLGNQRNAGALGRRQLCIGSCAPAGLLQVGVGVGALAGRCWRGIGGGVLARRWRCHSFGAGVLVAEEEEPTINMRWKVEGGRGKGEGGSGETIKSWVGGGVIICNHLN
jgi:hypothetical protein